MNGCSKALCPMQVGCADNCKLTKKECPYFTAISGYQEMVDKIKAEVAREIFAEIEAKICEKLPVKIFSCIDGKPFAGNETSVGRERALYEVLALVLELKKKYTEGKNDKQ